MNVLKIVVMNLNMNLIINVIHLVLKEHITIILKLDVLMKYLKDII